MKVYDITVGSGEEVVKGTKVKARSSRRRTSYPSTALVASRLQALAERVGKDVQPGSALL